MIGINGLIYIGQRLRLNPLGAVHHQKRSFDRTHGPADFICKIHMTRRVNQIEDVTFAILCIIFNAHRIGFDGDAPLTFDIHRVEKLLFHIAILNGPRRLDQTIGQGRFPMINMGND